MYRIMGNSKVNASVYKKLKNKQERKKISQGFRFVDLGGYARNKETYRLKKFKSGSAGN